MLRFSLDLRMYLFVSDYRFLSVVSPPRLIGNMSRPLAILIFRREASRADARRNTAVCSASSVSSEQIHGGTFKSPMRGTFRSKGDKWQSKRGTKSVLYTTQVSRVARAYTPPICSMPLPHVTGTIQSPPEKLIFPTFIETGSFYSPSCARAPPADVLSPHPC